MQTEPIIINLIEEEKGRYRLGRVAKNVVEVQFTPPLAEIVTLSIECPALKVREEYDLIPSFSPILSYWLPVPFPLSSYPYHAVYVPKEIGGSTVTYIGSN